MKGVITDNKANKRAKRAINKTSQVATVSHTHNNKALLDSITQQNFDDITYTKNAIAGIASVLGITLNPNGTVNTDGYSAHTHNYDNNGIPGTTGGVN